MDNHSKHPNTSLAKNWQDTKEENREKKRPPRKRKEEGKKRKEIPHRIMYTLLFAQSHSAQ
jgi:hypothetical protein